MINYKYINKYHKFCITAQNNNKKFITTEKHSMLLCVDSIL